VLVAPDCGRVPVGTVVRAAPAAVGAAVIAVGGAGAVVDVALLPQAARTAARVSDASQGHCRPRRCPRADRRFGIERSPFLIRPLPVTFEDARSRAIVPGTALAQGACRAKPRPAARIGVLYTCVLPAAAGM
jgi:hypothetical protein